MTNGQFKLDFLNSLFKSEAKEEPIKNLINNTVNKLLENGYTYQEIKNDLTSVLNEAQNNTKALNNIIIAKKLLDKKEN